MLYHWLIRKLLLAVLLCATVGGVHAANFTSRAGGSWAVVGTWRNGTVCGTGTFATAVPVAGDVVRICTANAVTVTASTTVAAASLTFDINSATNSSVTLGAGAIMNISGAVTFEGTANNDATLAVTSGTLNAGSIAITGAGGGGDDSIVSVASGGAINVTGNISFAGTAAQAEFQAPNGSNVFVGGSFGSGGTSTFGATSKITFNGATNNVTIGPYTYGNVEISKTGATTTVRTFSGGTTLINGTLDVKTGTLDIENHTWTVVGATTVDAGASLTFTTSTTGNKTWRGLVTVNGTWDSATESHIFETGGLKFNGDGITNTFVGGSGTYTFQGAGAQEIGGTGAMSFTGTIAIGTAITVTNSATHATGITTTGAITGISGTNWTQAPNSYLSIEGNFLTTAGTVLNASNAGNTIVYASGATRAIKLPSGATGTYHHLRFTGVGTKTMPAAALNINGNFTHNGTSATASVAGGNITVLGNFNIGAGASFSAGAATSAFTHSVGGNWDNDGIFTSGNRSTVVFNGSAVQDLGGDAVTSFSNLEISNASGVTLSASPSVTGLLRFTSGKVTGGASIVEFSYSPLLTGTISSSVASPTVTGVGTSFLTELAVGQQFISSTGLVVGTIQAIGSATSLTLTANASVTLAAGSTYRRSAVGSGPTSAKYIAGCVRKDYLAGWTGAFVFPIGDASNYTPVTQTFSANSGLGDVTACVTATDHPQVTAPISSTGINKDRSVNRYWTLTANAGGSGTPTGTYGVSFAYIGGTFPSPDNDTGTGTGSTYGIQRYLGALWFGSTVSGTPSLTSAATTNNETTEYGAYAVGEMIKGYSNGSPGRFNAYETGATPTTTVLGKIFTKVAGVTSNVDIAALNAAGTALDTSYVGAVKIWVIDASNDAGAMDANGCRTSWTYLGSVNPVSNGTTIPLAPAPPSPHATTAAFTSGVGLNNGRKTQAVPWPANAYPIVRLLFQDTVAAGFVGCSNDAFALRPKELLLEAKDDDWLTAGTTRATPLHNTGATGGVVHAAGSAFTIRATALDGSTSCSGTGCTTTNYVASPKLKTGPVCGSQPSSGCSVGVLTPAGTTISPWVWSGTLGVRTAPVTYDQVGTFTLELEDATYADIDTADGTPATGATGYTIPQASPSPREIGRFVPHHFDVVKSNPGLNPPQFQTFGVAETSCNTTVISPRRSFTYVGQPFGYINAGLTTPPFVTVTAKDATGNTTSNYKGTLWKITTAASDVVQTYSNNTVGPGIDTVLNATTRDITAANGTGTFLVSTADKISYQRSTVAPEAAFTAKISLTIAVRDNSETGVTGNPAQITSTTDALFDGVAAAGIAFDSGALVRYGRLRLTNAAGSAKMDLNIPVAVQYWNGTGFASNVADNCTALPQGNYTLDATSYSGGLTNLNVPAGNLSVTTPIVKAGIGQLKLKQPTSSATGSVTLCGDLDVAAGGDTSCAAGTPSDKTWLQGPWGTGVTTYDKDPTARAAFGVYGAQPRNFIFYRENY